MLSAMQARFACSLKYKCISHFQLLLFSIENQARALRSSARPITHTPSGWQNFRHFDRLQSRSFGFAKCSKAEMSSGAAVILESDFLSGNPQPARKLCIIVLNYSLPTRLAKLWDIAAVKLCADGGCNRLYDELPSMLPDEDPDFLRKKFLPDIIKGDMDSMREDIREFYTLQGVPIEDLSEDQDSTDLEKCISHLESEVLGSALPFDQHVILAVGALGGRLDHTLANLNTLYTFRHLNLVLWGEGNLVRLCRAGKSIIHPHSLEGPTCGIIPLGTPATVTSTGLKWNLNNTEMKVRGLLSTSNVLVSDEITVDTDEDLIWTTEVSEG